MASFAPYASHGRLSAYENIGARHHNSVIKKLEQRGFSRTQAEGITDALQELDTSALATKADLRDLEMRFYKYFGAILIAHGLGTAALTVALLQLLR